MCLWWYVFVFVNGGFWQFSLLCAGLTLLAYNFTRLLLYLFNYYYWRRFVVQCIEVEIVGLSLGSLAGLRCFWGFRCVGELEVICT